MTTLIVTDPLTNETWTISVPENFTGESVIAALRKSEKCGIDPLAGFSDLIFGENEAGDGWELQFFDAEVIYTLKAA